MDVKLNIEKLVKQSVKKATDKDLQPLIDQELRWEMQKLIRAEFKKNKEYYNRMLISEVKKEIKKNISKMAEGLVKQFF